MEIGFSYISSNGFTSVKFPEFQNIDHSAKLHLLYEYNPGAIVGLPEYPRSQGESCLWVDITMPSVFWRVCISSNFAWLTKGFSLSAYAIRIYEENRTIIANDTVPMALLFLIAKYTPMAARMSMIISRWMIYLLKKISLKLTKIRLKINQMNRMLILLFLIEA